MTELFERVLSAYLTHAPKQCEQLVGAAAEAEANVDLVRIAAHSLKSSCASVGADGLARVCRDLEELARGQRAPESYEATALRIEQGLNLVCDALRDRLRVDAEQAA